MLSPCRNRSVTGTSSTITLRAESATRLPTLAEAALGADFVGVDLLPNGHGRWVVLEVNGAVDFTSAYSLAGENAFERVVQPANGQPSPSQ